MFCVTAILTAALAVQGIVASPVRSRTSYAVKESHNAPRQWRRVARAPEEHTIHLKIALKQSNFDVLERHLYEVSDPSHHRYGQHLSADDVNELVKPTDETLDLVHEWLRENGVEGLDYSPSKDWIDVALPVKSVEQLLDTEYHIYEHEDGTQLVRTSEWSLPRHLHVHVDTIQPTTSFFRATPQKSHIYHDNEAWAPHGYKPPTNATISRVCNITSVTPECFANLYSTLGYIPQVPGKNKVAFNNFLNEVPIRPDTAKFLGRYRPEAVSGATDFKFISIANGPFQDGPVTAAQLLAGSGEEANLDVQAIIGISYPTPVTAYTTGGSPPFIPDIDTPTDTNEPYLDWLSYVLNQTDVPQVISTSYGDDEQTVPFAYALRACQQFAQLGARGVSLLFSSGDSGVGRSGGCLSNDGKNTTQFLPSFPASCPYVTSVGATHLFEPEVVAYSPSRNGKYAPGTYASGGGFSNYFAQPEYQHWAVKGYVEDLNGLYDGLYNKSGRAYPDVAAQGQRFAFVWNGTFATISGTSASSPLLAGIISLVNDALIADGKPPLGFLNPWLYKRGNRGFTDVTSGSAVGCGVDGFPATKGWDPVTGFGTPVFPKLVSLAGAKIHHSS